MGYGLQRTWKWKFCVKTWFVSKVVLLKETLKFKGVINLCYLKQMIALQNIIPTFQTWAMVSKVSKTLIPTFTQCVLNQSKRYWLLFDAKSITITMCTLMDSRAQPSFCVASTNFNTNGVVRYVGLYLKLNLGVF
jgi:hypothetical protein